MKRSRDNMIEVAVRARPLNIYENHEGQETAWDIKRPEPKPSKITGRPIELVDDSHKVIQLKNKYRFGLDKQKTQPKMARSVTRTGR